MQCNITCEKLMIIYKINVAMTGNFQELEILGGAYKRTFET